MKALGVNNDRSPKHPLYIPSHERPRAWTGLSLERARCAAAPPSCSRPAAGDAHDHR